MHTGLTNLQEFKKLYYVQGGRMYELEGVAYSE